MPTCQICKTKWYYQTYMEPAESCDCGQKIHREDLHEMSEEEYTRRVARWNHVLEIGDEASDA